MEFYGNTIPQWLLAFVIILLSMIVAKAFYFVCSTSLRKLTKKTKTNLDDILLDKLEEPIVFGIIIFGFWYSTQFLNIFTEYVAVINNSFHFLVTINVTWLISRIVISLILEYLDPLVKKTESELDDQLLPIVRKGINIIIWILGFLVALNNAGINVTALVAGMGVGGIAFAMASKDTISNLFAGFTIFTDHPFKINDRIKTNEFDGFVKEIGLRTTRILTTEGRMVIVPNEKITNQTIQNISLEEFRRYDFKIHISNANKPEKVSKAVDLIKDILSKRNEIVFYRSSLVSFDDFSLQILVLYAIKSSGSEKNYLEIQNEINQSILKEIHNIGVQFPKYPNRSN